MRNLPGFWRIFATLRFAFIDDKGMRNQMTRLPSAEGCGPAEGGRSQPSDRSLSDVWRRGTSWFRFFLGRLD
jgi:hypothetical protein